MRSLAYIAAAPTLAGCTTEQMTEPTQTKTDQLAISAVVDQAVDSLNLALPHGAKVSADTSFVDMSGADKKAADVIVESRLGAQSADHHSFLIGIPSLTIPAPLAGPLTTPKLERPSSRNLR
jgi:hypothetical protein